LGCVLETNHIFDRPDGSLRARGYGLRIRSARDTATGEQSHTLTLKGPVAAGPFKSREELEVRISDADTAASMLQQLGFVRILCYQKRRESWRLEECRVELDEPPHIGLFVEIEGPDEAAIRFVRDRLGLADAVHEKASYVPMLMAYCQEHGIADRMLPLPDASAAR
jgi:adenylate cyclase class 2